MLQSLWLHGVMVRKTNEEAATDFHLPELMTVPGDAREEVSGSQSGALGIGSNHRYK